MLSCSLLVDLQMSLGDLRTGMRLSIRAQQTPFRKKRTGWEAGVVPLYMGRMLYQVSYTSAPSDP